MLLELGEVPVLRLWPHFLRNHTIDLRDSAQEANALVDRSNEEELLHCGHFDLGSARLLVGGAEELEQLVKVRLEEGELGGIVAPPELLVEGANAEASPINDADLEVALLIAGPVGVVRVHVPVHHGVVPLVHVADVAKLARVSVCDVEDPLPLLHRSGCHYVGREELLRHLGDELDAHLHLHLELLFVHAHRGVATSGEVLCEVVGVPELAGLEVAGHGGGRPGHLLVVLPSPVAPLLIIQELLVRRLNLPRGKVLQCLLRAAIVDKLGKDNEVGGVGADVREVVLRDPEGQVGLQQPKGVDLHAILLQHGGGVHPVGSPGALHGVGELHEELRVQVGGGLLVLDDDERLVRCAAAAQLLGADNLLDAVVCSQDLAGAEGLGQPRSAVLFGSQLLLVVRELHAKARPGLVLHVVLLELLHADARPSGGVLSPLSLAALLRWMWTRQPLLLRVAREQWLAAGRRSRLRPLGALVGLDHEFLARQLDAHPALRRPGASSSLVVQAPLLLDKFDLLQQSAGGQALRQLRRRDAPTLADEDAALVSSANNFPHLRHLWRCQATLCGVRVREPTAGLLPPAAGAGPPSQGRGAGG
mmetsp:Transcript_72917/g.193679  ORF Transcript_72917/g.193679 Transcript_72917/m.193679 type:complete len:591 (-) Transcript_72917:22-1794(-)